MPTEKVSMRKIKEVLKLNHGGVGNREIARRLHISAGSVSNYLTRAKEAGLIWPLNDDYSEDKVYNILFPTENKKTAHPLPDFAKVHQELKRKGVTLMLLWYEYQQQTPGGYSYSRYCELHQFIKNNAFELDSFYLKTPARIGALMMIMTLCLMVYNFAQYNMRKCMEEQGDVLPNQVGKPIKNPTMKWVAELINMIAVVTINTDGQRHLIVTNVKKVHQRIIVYFGKHALHIYGLPALLERVEINYSNYKNLLHWCER